MASGSTAGSGILRVSSTTPETIPLQAPSPLPASPAPLIGRDDDLVRLRDLALQPEVSLITLLGPAGVGKTSLALALAAELTGAFEDGVAWAAVGLAGNDVSGIATVARALGISEQPDTPLREQVIAALAPRRMLLVLDGVDGGGSVAGSSRFVMTLLALCPRVTLLATSAIPLDLREERLFTVAPLALPGERVWASMSEDERGAAVGLFVERARDTYPGFTLTMANTVAVAEICRRLDGLPLAIEIVAARARRLAPQAMLSRLDPWLPRQAAGPVECARRAILRGAVGWSHSLLDPAEVTLFRRLAVFQGSFTTDAAAAVADPGAAPDDVVDRLRALAAGGLLHAESERGTLRYWMGEPVRAFARERLADTGEDGEFRGRHAAWYLALARRAEEGLRGAELGGWLEQIEAEIDNIRAALEWLYTSGQPDDGLAATVALNRFWASRAHLSEGWSWIERGLRADITPGVRIRALNDASFFAILQGDVARARAVAAESLGLAREVGDADGITIGLDNLGELALTAGDYAAATGFFDESLAIWRARDRRWNAGMTLISLACATLNAGDSARARACCDEARAILDAAGDPRAAGLALLSLAWLDLHTGDTGQARAQFQAALATFRRLETPLEIAEALEGLAAIAGASGDDRQAARLYGAAEASRAATGSDPAFLSRIGPRAERLALRERLADARFAALRAAGAATPLDALVGVSTAHADVAAGR
jgi:non-specific serine/threonine protein kinase